MLKILFQMQFSTVKVYKRVEYDLQTFIIQISDLII